MIRQCCKSLSSPSSHAHTVIMERLSMAIALASFAVLHLNDYLVYAYVCFTPLLLSFVFSWCSHASCLSYFPRFTLSEYVWKGAMHIYCVVITFSTHAQTSMKWMCYTLSVRVKMNKLSQIYDVDEEKKRKDVKKMAKFAGSDWG